MFLAFQRSLVLLTALLCALQAAKTPEVPPPAPAGQAQRPQGAIANLDLREYPHTVPTPCPGRCCDLPFSQQHGWVCWDDACAVSQWMQPSSRAYGVSAGPMHAV